ncbi:MAG TPA: metallophosphoesterase [Ktedonobacter sp.]|jgi:acid phosphatase type 7|nr:metallophosphoesterase [Ktedonobacter sp.]HAG99861.1 metallophosphoesterase [Ktedonobacter sp.]HAT46468.1 metallophosphoesterase [Ktedonobacter sp.]HBE27185.1 metallophosphoesterase [Ktedonobacter sp.]HCF84101.1 metallophosphoesterase [Ktedonobacter sp.]
MNQQPPGNSSRRFSIVRPSPAEELVIRRTQESLSNQPPRPLPTPTGKPPYHVSLDDMLTPAQMQAMRTSGQLVFHTAGDTGGVKAPQAQEIVMMHMDTDLTVTDATTRPAFFYQLGDVVYYYGEASNYYSQFYEPNMHYTAPILAIPGNHDGDVLDTSVPSLAAFVENFCATEPHLTAESGDSGRDAMTQPNVYWTLDTPFITFIGLYTNVPEGGWVDADQTAWLASELTSAPQDKALIVAMHHPIYSADTFHSGSAYMGQLLDQAIQKTNRIPDAVFAGHVHNYQRFTRVLNGRDIPYIVAGAGGYWHLHSMQKPQGVPIQTPYPMPDMGVTLESYCDNRHGYMRMEVTAQTLKGEYFSVPRPQESWSDPAQLVDSFTLDLKQHRLV